MFSSIRIVKQQTVPNAQFGLNFETREKARTQSQIAKCRSAFDGRVSCGASEIVATRNQVNDWSGSWYLFSPGNCVEMGVVRRNPKKLRQFPYYTVVEIVVM